MFDNGEPRSWVIAIFKAPRRAQSGIGDHPLLKPSAIQTGFLGDNPGPPPHPAGRKSGRQVWIAEEIGIFESALSNQPLRINHKPATRPTIEHIVMVEVTVKNHALPLICE